MSIIPIEAALIREAAERILDGDSLRSICLDWNSRGLSTPKGGRWQTSPLKRAITNPRVVGDRLFRGRIAETAGEWPAILDREVYGLLVARLGQNSGPGGGRPPVHLLSRLLRCGRCGTPMVMSWTIKKQRRYCCPPGPRGCNGLSALAEPLEDYISARALEALSEARLRSSRRSRGGDRDIVAGLRKVEAALGELGMDYYSRRVISRAAFERAHTDLENQQAILRGQLASLQSRRVLDIAAGASLDSSTWRDQSSDRKRAVLGGLIDRITLMPAEPSHRRVLSSETVVITWR